MSEPAPRAQADEVGARGATLVLALVLCCLLALPAAFRAGEAGAPALLAWLALSAATSFVVLPLALSLRARSASLVPWLEGAAFSALPLALFASVLRSATHQRPLGGTTFAIFALVVVSLGAGASLRSRRCKVASASSGTAWAARLFTLLSALSALAALALVAKSPELRASSVDLSGLVVASLVAGRSPLRLQRVPQRWLMLGWLGLLILGALSLQRPQLSAQLTRQAPISFAAWSWLGGGA